VNFDYCYSKARNIEIKEAVAKISKVKMFRVPSDSADVESIRLSKKVPLKPEIGRAYRVFARTGILPITLSKLELNNSSYSLGKSISLGVGVSWIWGEATYRDANTIDIIPDIFFGLGVDVGPRINDQNKFEVASGVNLYVGSEKVGLSIGRDFIKGVYMIGITTTIDFSSLNLTKTHVISISEIIRPDSD
jgi:hypothetical protein